MTHESFGTLSADMMERGSMRVRAVLEGADPTRRWPEPGRRPEVEPPAARHRDVRFEDLDDNVRLFPRGDAAPSTPPTQPPTQLTSCRAGPGAKLMIRQPASGDMSEVTVFMERQPRAYTHDLARHGQRPTSIVYKRRTLADLAREAERAARNGPPEPVWIEAPGYSGPDRRVRSVSPERERRSWVPPRIRVGVRLEQERFLRLKLAGQESGRTQQDLMTSAIDHYLDKLGMDRFVRVAMSFGSLPPKTGPGEDH